MSISNTELKTLLAKEVNRYEGVYVPLRASLLERALIRTAKTSDLHPNPDDEFSFPNIGPNYSIISNYESKFRTTGKVKDDPWGESIMVQKIHPSGYMILNGHHRWAAAMKVRVPAVQVSIVNPKK